MVLCDIHHRLFFLLLLGYFLLLDPLLFLLLGLLVLTLLGDLLLGHVLGHVLRPHFDVLVDFFLHVHDLLEHASAAVEFFAYVHHVAVEGGDVGIEFALVAGVVLYVVHRLEHQRFELVGPSRHFEHLFLDLGYDFDFVLARLQCFHPRFQLRKPTVSFRRETDELLNEFKLLEDRVSGLVALFLVSGHLPDLGLEVSKLIGQLLSCLLHD